MRSARRTGIKLSFIDLGWVCIAKYTGGAVSSGEQVSPSFERYADAICDGLSLLEYPSKELPTLVLETGRALVDDSGYLISTVEATKRLPMVVVAWFSTRASTFCLPRFGTNTMSFLRRNLAVFGTDRAVRTFVHEHRRCATRCSFPGVTGSAALSSATSARTT